MKWNDITTYSQGQNPKVPQTFELVAPAKPTLRIVVTRNIYQPDRWFLSCRGLDISHQLLASLDRDAAFVEAIHVCHDLSVTLCDRLRALEATQPQS